MRLTEETKPIWKKAEKINDGLWKYYNIFYSDESNERFDEEHDSLYYHIQGWNETLEELEQDIRQDSDWTSKDAETWTKVLRDEAKVVEQLKAYYKATKTESPNYIYA